MKKVLIFLKDYIQEYGKIFTLSFFVLIACLSAITCASLAPNTLKVSFIDVGQGDAILIVSPSGKTLLVDGGPNNRVLEALSESLPIFSRRVDAIIATHPDADHITGLAGVLERFDVGAIIFSATGTTDLSDDFFKRAKSEGSSMHRARRGDVIDFHDGIFVHILSPEDVALQSRDANESSISILVEYGKHSILLTGDLPKKGEARLLTDGKIPRHITIFKAGHHGSDTSSGEQLLSYIRPEYAVVSAGKDNRYGHPHKETLARLKKYSKEILSTIDLGTISFVSDGHLLRITTEN